MRARIARTSKPAAKAIVRNARSTCLPPALPAGGSLAPSSGGGASMVIGQCLCGNHDARQLRDGLLLQRRRQLGVVHALGEALSVGEGEVQEVFEGRAL